MEENTKLFEEISTNKVELVKYTYQDCIKILTDRFSKMKEIYDLEKEYYEDLPYLFYESEFEQFILKNLQVKNDEVLREIFTFVEDVLKNGDNEIINLIGVTVIESLFFDSFREDIEHMKEYFGELTLKSYQGTVDYFANRN